MNSLVLSKQVLWQQREILNSGVDQTQLVIADAPTKPVPFSFMVMGDTDAGVEGSKSAFAEGFAVQLLRQLGQSRFLLHTGDVTYPVGSYENYLSGFLHPYRSLLKKLPSSAAYRANSVVFARPMLPVPGNHDYSDAGFGLWQRLLREACDRLRRTLNIDLGYYGGQGGEAYGQTFLDDLWQLTPDQLSHHLKRHYCAVSDMGTGSVSGAAYCLSYQPGQFTRLPNRYYTFRYGGIDFFALDSNTWKTAPEVEGFDQMQLTWLEQRLAQSVSDPSVIGRIIYLHHSPYTTEASRWQQSETLWVRRHLRAVLARVRATVGQQLEQVLAGCPLVDLVISGHAHCLEHLKTLDTEQGDAQMDWVVCGGSGASVRPQRKDNEADILENITQGQRLHTEKVATSHFFAGRQGSRHSQGATRQKIYSFLKVDVCPDRASKLRVVPFLVENKNGQWKTSMLNAFNISSSSRRIRHALPLRA